MSRKRWFAAATAAAVLAAGFSAGSVFLATADDRRLANSYQSVLSAKDRERSSQPAPLQGPQGRAGTVFGYQGQPSWVMVTVQPSIRPEGRFQIQIVTRDGRYLPLGHTVLDSGQAWGRQLPLDLSQVHELRFIGADGRTTFTATFNAVSPWN